MGLDSFPPPTLWTSDEFFAPADNYSAAILTRCAVSRVVLQGLRLSTVTDWWQLRNPAERTWFFSEN